MDAYIVGEVNTKGLEVWACLWKDAHQSSLEYELSEITHRPMLYITVGICLKNDSTGISFAADKCETNTYRSTNFVPAEMIINAWRVGSLTPKRARKVKGPPIQPPQP